VRSTVCAQHRHRCGDDGGGHGCGDEPFAATRAADHVAAVCASVTTRMLLLRSYNQPRTTAPDASPRSQPGTTHSGVLARPLAIQNSGSCQNATGR
jgi:hypothetical protein